MGILVVKKVKYNGDNYFYESPELRTGLNVIYGDNGSGKSTFSYFLEYGLGGKVAPFNSAAETDKYRKILDDTNNYVQLDLCISGKAYSLKRFLGETDIFIQEDDVFIKLPISRIAAPRIFSDWILEKLEIPLFEMSLGTANWKFGFADLFRLLNYDQDTENRKIYKAPPAENFITESLSVRKAIFEVLLGISSAAYFAKQDEVKKALKLRDSAKSLVDNFRERYKHLNLDVNLLSKEKVEKEKSITSLNIQRDQYLRSNTNVPAKLAQLNELQSNLVRTELSVSEKKIKLSAYKIERDKIVKIHKDGLDEIAQLRKIIFTHDKLDLFKLEVCPFCATEKKPQEGYCICGSKYNDDDYEKFVYSSGEYKDILKHKEKSIETIEIAQEDYDQKVGSLNLAIQAAETEAQRLKLHLSKIIMTSEFSGNSTLIEELNREIIKLTNELFHIEKNLDIADEDRTLETQLKARTAAYTKLYKEFIQLKSQFEISNAQTITNFNTIYSDLISKSSLKKAEAEINEDYMPVIDNGNYNQASAGVPKRLMYYFTILSMALKYPSVKHPKFLLIDTPENLGIDRDMLKNDLLLLDRAIELSKLNPNDPTPQYQVILTIGYDRLPAEYETYVVERFNAKENSHILKQHSTEQPIIESEEI